MQISSGSINKKVSSRKKKITHVFERGNVSNIV